MDNFCQNLKVKVIPISTGKMICVLNEKDAAEFGAFVGDRLELTYNKKVCVAVLDITKDSIGENNIGLFKEVADTLGVKGKEQLCVALTASLKSTEYIKKKMRGEVLSEMEIREIVKDISQERLSEIETVGFVSAVFMRGLDFDETVYMTKALIADGNRMEFSKGTIVDKHSVGGCNGRATMILVPIVACTGLKMPKTSSRSITSAAGTADSMEVLAPVNLDTKKIRAITEKCGGVIAWGGAVDLAPADDKIIKIEHPLSLDPEGQVIASVLAKKVSVGSKYVVIDLPVGKNVKIRDKETALRMAKKFVQVGKEVGIEVESVITDGEDPSGLAFGAALEAKYALEILEGKRFDNLAQKACELAGVLFEMVNMAPSGKGYAMAVDILKSGKALAKMQDIIRAQGGKILSSGQINFAQYNYEVTALEEGVIEEVDTRELTKVARLAGAPANHYAGVLLNKVRGDKVKKGDVLYTIYAEQQMKLQSASTYAKEADTFSFKRIVLGTVKFDSLAVK